MNRPLTPALSRKGAREVFLHPLPNKGEDRGEGGFGCGLAIKENIVERKESQLRILMERAGLQLQVGG
jgi:hypothetical protein